MQTLTRTLTRILLIRRQPPKREKPAAGASPPVTTVAVPVEDRLAELDLNSPTANAGLSVKEVRPPVNRPRSHLDC